VSLSIGRGEKLPASQGAGLTAKGRAKYNRETGSNLKAPAPNPKTDADKGRKASFCARMGAVAAKAKDGERAKAALACDLQPGANAELLIVSRTSRLASAS
jgi:hypothetical protein